MLSTHRILDGMADLTIYDFTDVGDVLEKHTHDADTVHYSAVAAGSLRYEVTGKPDAILPTGSLVKTEPGQEHGFVALVPRSRLINIRYGGQP